MKTPLHYVDHHGFRNVYDADGRLICDNDFDGNDPQYAARIVACVNACAGMDDPEAEIAALREALHELTAHISVSDFDNDVSWSVFQLKIGSIRKAKKALKP